MQESLADQLVIGSQTERSNSSALETFAVAIPSLNQGRYIEHCISSLKSRHPIRAFVRDGQSTDDTIEKLRHAPEFVRWKSAADGGQSDAINKAFEQLEGTIMCYMNCDDGYLPGALDQVADAFQKTNADIVLGWAQNIDENGERGVWGPTEASIEQIDYLPVVFEPAAFWRPHVWRQLGPFRTDLHYVFGWDFMCMAAREFRVHIVQTPISINRLQKSRKTRFGGERRLREILSLVERHSGARGAAMYQQALGIPRWLANSLFTGPGRRLRKVVYNKLMRHEADRIDYDLAYTIYRSARGY